MEVIRYGEKIQKPLVLCLGYFDAVHIGHNKIISEAIKLSKKLNAEPAVLAFVGGKNNALDIFTFPERLIKFKALGIDTVIFQELDSAFMSKSADEFLNEIFSCYNVLGVVVGEDFTYGKMARGDTAHLKNYIKNTNAKLTVCEKVTYNGEKISSKDIKTHLLNGNLELANTLLGSNYFVRGEVKKGREIGKKIGFPTANIVTSKDKLLIKKGVYLTCTVIENKIYSCLTNVGNQPTVNGKENVIETYIHNFNGDLYGKGLSIYFIEKIRDIKKFSSLEELKNQLKKDMEYLK